MAIHASISAKTGENDPEMVAVDLGHTKETPTLANTKDPDIEFDVQGVAPADYDWLFYFLKWIVPMIQLGVWTCILVLPLIDYTTRLVWLWTVVGVQLVYTAVGACQIRNAFIGMKRVKEVCLKYSEINNDNNKSDGESTLISSEERSNKSDGDSTFISSEERSTSSTEQTSHEIIPMMSHVFIMPNYSEPEEMLGETLTQLSSHPLAWSYTIVLAMEDKEQDHESKAERLIEKFHDKFHRVFFTTHVLQKEIEDRGKASNESWAARSVSKEVELYPEFYASALCTHVAPKDDPEAANLRHRHCCDQCLKSFSKSKVMLHVLDADAHVHGAYTLEVEEKCREILKEQADISKSSTDPLPGSITRSVFAAPAVMSRNVLEVPWLTRMHDTAWSAAAFQNLTSYAKIGFPLSNYSFSLQLMDDIGFFDTNHEAITEDMHMFLKAFYKTNGACRLQPIYVPHNMLNLNTGGGWFHTCYHRFVQAERHARAVNELAYALRQMAMNPWGLHKFIALWQTFVAAIFPPVIPCFVGLAAPFCQLLHWIHGTFDEGPLYFLLMWTQAFGLMTVVIIGCQLYAYDGATRATNTHLYQKPNLSMKETLMPLPLTFFTLWIYVVAPFAMASVRSILPECITRRGSFVVSQKV